MADADPAGIDPARIRSVLCSDWGLWKTATTTLGKVVSYAEGLGGIGTIVRERASVLAETVERSPKSIRWKARAALGERVKWYLLTEEVG